MAHWAFSAQYLKTSMVLPRLLTQAQLEYTSADTIRRENRLSNRAMNRGSLELLRSVDDAIEKEKAALRRIIIKIVVYNVIMTLLIAGQSVFNLKCFDWIDSEKLAENISENLYEAILLLNAIILAYSVVRIRRAIKSLHNAFPNESFMRVHLANSFVYAILYMILGIAAIV